MNTNGNRLPTAVEDAVKTVGPGLTVTGFAMLAGLSVAAFLWLIVLPVIGLLWVAGYL